MRDRVRGLLGRRGGPRAVIAMVLVVITAAAVSLALGWPRAEADPPSGTGAVDTSGAPHLPTTTTPSPSPAPLVAATTGGPAPTTPPPRRPGTRPADPPPEPPARPARANRDAPPPGDTLKRRDKLPDGVDEQIRFFVGGGPECDDPGGDQPEIRGVAAVQEIPSGTRLCFGGFDLADPLTVTVAPPVGPTVVTELAPPLSLEEGFVYRYPRIPGDPPGRYEVTAEQGALTATLDFTVQRASGPRLWVQRRSGAVPGDDINVYVGGFPAGRRVDLHLYGGTPMTYRTSLPVRVDEHGEGHAVVDTKADDAPGCYGISHPLVYDPDREPRTTFCLQHP